MAWRWLREESPDYIDLQEDEEKIEINTTGREDPGESCVRTVEQDELDDLDENLKNFRDAGDTPSKCLMEGTEKYVERSLYSDLHR